jgi:hypothetical protein
MIRSGTAVRHGGSRRAHPGGNRIPDRRTTAFPEVHNRDHGGVQWPAGCRPEREETRMRKLYSALAWTILGGVVVQAAAIAFGFGGMTAYVMEGGVVDKALVESGSGSFTGEAGFPVHGIVGGIVLPVVALLLAVSSFWVRVPRSRRWAWGLFVLVVLQGELGYMIEDLPYVGLVHGANALAVLLVAYHVARMPARSAASASATAEAGGRDEREEPTTRVPA